MKNFFKQSKLILLLIFVWAGAMSVLAQTSEIPQGYEEMELLRTYNTSGEGVVMLYYTPVADGKLTAIQTGSYENHMFFAPPVYSDVYAYDNNYDKMLQTDYTVNPGGGYTLSYGLMAGKTYYFVAKLSNNDPINTVIFDFEAGSSDMSIELGVPYVVNYQSPVYVYSAENSGVLSAQWSIPNSNATAYFGEIAVGQEQFFLYNDIGCSEQVPPLSIENGDMGYLVKFYVEKGKNYYLYLNSNTSLQVVFTLDVNEEATGSIYSIEPIPGTTYDFVNFRYYWNLQTSPNWPTVESVEITYTELFGNAPITVEGPTVEMGGDALRIPADKIVQLIENNELKPNSEIIYTLHGLKAGGVYVTKNEMTQGKEFVTIGENGEVKITFFAGAPLTVESAYMPSVLYQTSAANDASLMGEINYSGPIATFSEITIIEGKVTQGGQSSGDDAPKFITVPESHIKINGNTIYIDFSGLNLTSLEPGDVSVWVAGVVGENGLYADYEGFSVGLFYLTLMEGSNTGVAGVINDEGEYKVYNSKGVLIPTVKNANDLNNLDKGIYIVNGNKVVVK